MVGHIISNVSFVKYAHLAYNIFSREIMFSSVTWRNLKG